MTKVGVKRNTGLEGLLFLVMLFILSAFLAPARQVSTTGIASNIKVSQQEHDILVSVRMAKNIEIEFFMFNLEGELISKYEISGSKDIIISKMQKGIYMYEFFNHDQHLKTGKIELK